MAAFSYSLRFSDLYYFEAEAVLARVFGVVPELLFAAVLLALEEPAFELASVFLFELADGFCLSFCSSFGFCFSFVLLDCDSELFFGSSSSNLASLDDVFFAGLSLSFSSIVLLVAFSLIAAYLSIAESLISRDLSTALSLAEPT